MKVCIEIDIYKSIRNFPKCDKFDKMQYIFIKIARI